MSVSLDEGKDSSLTGLHQNETGEVTVDYTKHPKYQEILQQVKQEYESQSPWVCVACKTQQSAEEDMCLVCYTPKPPVKYVVEQRIKQLQAEEILRDAQLSQPATSSDKKSSSSSKSSHSANAGGGNAPTAQQKHTDDAEDIYRLVGLPTANVRDAWAAYSSKTSKGKAGTYRDAVGRQATAANVEREILMNDVNYDDEKERPKHRLDAQFLATTSLILPRFVPCGKSYKMSILFRNVQNGPVWPQKPNGESAVSLHSASGYQCIVESYPVQFLSDEQAKHMLMIHQAQMQQFEEARARQEQRLPPLNDIEVPQLSEDPRHASACATSKTKHRTFPYPGEHVLSEMDIYIPTMEDLCQMYALEDLWKNAPRHFMENEERLRLRMTDKSCANLPPSVVQIPAYVRLAYPRSAVVPNTSTNHFTRLHRYVGVDFDQCGMPISVDPTAPIQFGPCIGILITVFETGQALLTNTHDHGSPANDPRPPEFLEKEFLRYDTLYMRIHQRNNPAGNARGTRDNYGNHGAGGGDYSGFGSDAYFYDDNKDNSIFVDSFEPDAFGAADAGPPPLYRDDSLDESMDYELMKINGSKVGTWDDEISDFVNGTTHAGDASPSVTKDKPGGKSKAGKSGNASKSGKPGKTGKAKSKGIKLVHDDVQISEFYDDLACYPSDGGGEDEVYVSNGVFVADADDDDEVYVQPVATVEEPESDMDYSSARNNSQGQGRRTPVTSSQIRKALEEQDKEYDDVEYYEDDEDGYDYIPADDGDEDDARGGDGGDDEQGPDSVDAGSAQVWSCAVCTFDNEMQDKLCEMCMAPRPSTYGKARRA